MKKNIFKWIILILILGGIIFYLIAHFISTRGLIVKEYAIKNELLPESFDGFKIVQFSDIHFGSTVDIKRLKKIVNKINDQNPDIILFTGDLFDNRNLVSDKDLKEIVKTLNKLNPKIDTYAVLGNHDYENKLWNKIQDKLNFKILNNTYDIIYNNSNNPIVLTGIDDALKGKPDYNNAFSFKNEISDEIYTIVMLHEPDQVKDFMNKEKFNLVIAGHSHLGQVRLPLIGAIWTPKGAKTYYDEHYIVNNADLYISGGIGTSMLDIRFFCKPSITLYRFYTK